jgi:hypothetical protein
MTRTLQESLYNFKESIKDNSKAIKRKLRNFGLALFASSMIVSCQDCNPFPPSDLPPEAVLTANKTSVNKGESVNVKLNGNARSLKNLKDANAKSDNFIISYHLDIDYDNNGTIDKTIEQQNPIDVNEQLNYAGKAKFYGIVTDNRGLTSDVKSLEVLVSETPLTNHTPSCILTSEKSSLKKGENTLISIDGTDEDGKSDIVNYKIKIDYDNNGVIDKQLENSTPFSTAEQFDIVGTAKVYGEVKDSKGAIDTKNLNILVSEIPENHSPIAELNANPISLKEGGFSKLELKGRDEDGDIITKYNLWADFNLNGKLDEDENIEQSNPISLLKQFNKAGKVRIYGKVIDSKGAEGTTNLEISVLESIGPTINLITNWDNLRKGEELNIKLNGTKGDGDIIKYILDFDEGNDGIFEKRVENNTPLDINQRFYDSNCVFIKGKIIDSNGKEDNKSLLLGLIEDLRIDFEMRENYKIGDRFNYKKITTNINPESKNIILDNQNKDSFSYNIIKDGNKKFGFNLDQDLIMKFEKEGNFSIETFDDKSRFGINEKTCVLWQGFPIWIRGPFYMSYPLENFILNQPGEYWLEMRFKYKIEGDDKLHEIYKYSPKIEVKN